MLVTHKLGIRGAFQLWTIYITNKLYAHLFYYCMDRHTSFKITLNFTPIIHCDLTSIETLNTSLFYFFVLEKFKCHLLFI